MTLKNALQTPAQRLKYSCAFSPVQRSPPQSALTSDLRKAVTSRVNDSGPPPGGQGAPFIRIRNCRQGNGGRKSKILGFFFL
jgi:hypothetical protein